jgi:uncharacterized surface protein with fasciclin (FAS1) repeats
MSGYPQLSNLTSLITGPLLANSSFNFVRMLNSTSNSSQLTLFAPTNAAIARITNNTLLTTLLQTTTTTGNITLLELVLANHILNISANASVLSSLLLKSNATQHLAIDFDYAATTLPTLSGFNVSLTGIIQNGTTIPAGVVPPLLFVQNAFVVTPNAIVAENGVVHVISNVIDPFILAAGGFFGPTKEVVVGVETTVGPLVRMITQFLNIQV